MALVYLAELRPTKLELLAAWLPHRPWYRGPRSGDVVRIGTYRFDDPAGEVGIETYLARVGDGPVMQIPLTYRGAPLDGADRWLVGTTEHSVLGRRWVYDGCADPVYAAALAAAIVTGGGAAEEIIDVDGRLDRREPTMAVRGSGTASAGPPGEAPVDVELGPVEVDEGDPTVIRVGAVELSVVRLLPDSGGAVEPGGVPGPGGVLEPVDGRLALCGTWDGQAIPRPLAFVSGID